MKVVLLLALVASLVAISLAEESPKQPQSPQPAPANDPAKTPENKPANNQQQPGGVHETAKNVIDQATKEVKQGVDQVGSKAGAAAEKMIPKTANSGARFESNFVLASFVILFLLFA